VKVENALEVLRIQAEALVNLGRTTAEEIALAAEIVLSCRGNVIVTGMGKAGAVGRKLAGTFCSTGTPAFFFHPAEGVHGDLGMLGSEDVVIALSNSGETDEIIAVLPAICRTGCRLIAITRRPESSLGRQADAVIRVLYRREACPHNLAPTTSTTVMMALGDALAICVMKDRQFTEADFARLHPSGALGRRLLLTAADLMRKGESAPIVPVDMRLADVLVKITEARAGAAAVVDRDGLLVGLFTDGDLRRTLQRGRHLLDEPVSKSMTRSPRTIGADHLAAEGLKEMEARKIGEIPVVDEAGHPLGMLNLKDCLRAGLV